MKFKHKPAFSTVEIIISMSVVAVLITIGLYVVPIVMMQSRDSVRKSTLTEITKLITEYRVTKSKLPDNVNFTADNVTIGDNSFQLVHDFNIEYVKRANKTSGSGTKYYYEKISRDYKLCLSLESGEIINQGSVECVEGLNI